MADDTNDTTGAAPATSKPAPRRRTARNATASAPTKGAATDSRRTKPAAAPKLSLIHI